MQPLQQVPGPYEDTTCQLVAAYGAPDHAHLQRLRRFRDTILSRSLPGRALITLYYMTSPFAAALVKHSRLVQVTVRYGVGAPLHRVASYLLD